MEPRFGRLTHLFCRLIVHRCKQGHVCTQTDFWVDSPSQEPMMNGVLTNGGGQSFVYSYYNILFVVLSLYVLNPALCDPVFFKSRTVLDLLLSSKTSSMELLSPNGLTSLPVPTLSLLIRLFIFSLPLTQISPLPFIVVLPETVSHTWNRVSILTFFSSLSKKPF